MKFYTLVSAHPVFVHQGRIWSDPMWIKDLERHFSYIESFALCCPVVHIAPPSDCAPLTESSATRLQLFPVPTVVKHATRFWTVPAFLLRLASVLRRSEILHFTAACHPVLYGIVIPMVRKWSKIGIVGCVESSFWRKASSSWPRRILSAFSERCVRAAIGNAHVTFLTQEAYVQELTQPRNSNHVIHAVWVDEELFVRETELSSLLEQRSREVREKVRLCYIGQLIRDKGPDLVVEAARILAKEGIPFDVDFYGKGNYQEELEKMTVGLEDYVHFRGTLTYGEPFFAKLRSYHALLLPTRSDESPRIILDSFSQAVPIISSDAPGMKRIRDGENGLKFASGSASGLAEVIHKFQRSPESLTRMSHSAWESGRQFTHQAMHRQRAQILDRAFPMANSLRSEPKQSCCSSIR